ncbi:4111_t:CDS:2, partial [Racocetra persica]
QVAGHWFWNTALYTAVLATILEKAALITEISEEYDSIIPKLFMSSIYYLFILLVPIICLLRDYVWK